MAKLVMGQGSLRIGVMLALALSGILAGCGENEDPGPVFPGFGTAGGGGSTAQGGSSGGTISGTGGTIVGGGSGGSGATCERMATHPEPCFEPCGGDPVGMWMLQETCFQDAYPESMSHTCIGNLTATPNAAELRLRFLNGGELHPFGFEYWDVTLRETTCEPCVNASVLDYALLAPPVTVTNQAAMSCAPACGLGVRGEYPADGAAGDIIFDFYWSADGNQLTLGEGISYFRVMTYCVSGDELWLRPNSIEATNGASYKFARVDCFGKPAPCAGRSAEQCPVGGRCTLGACTAASPANEELCAGLPEVDCGAVAGCSWDPNACTGSPGFNCMLGTCAEEPGCQLLTEPHTCTGTPTACAGRATADCVLGCGMGTCSSADATDERDCSAALFCQGPGCISTLNQCIGTTTCSQQWFENACQDVSCDWAASETCVGAPMPCEALPLDECALQPGCALSP